MGLAKLSGITRTSPITARFMFKTNGETAAAPAETTATQTALAGDAKAGKRVFKKCKACHKLKAGKNGVGPSLNGIIGRASATVDGFKYSKALQNADVTWTPDALAEFLKKPKTYLPGTKMVFAGLKKDKDIENLLAYLSENGG